MKSLLGFLFEQTARPFPPKSLTALYHWFPKEKCRIHLKLFKKEESRFTPRAADVSIEYQPLQ